MTDKNTARVDLNKLQYIGDQMANVMFKLAQRAGDPLTGDDVARMDELRKEWDLARRAEPSVAAEASGLEEALGQIQWLVDFAYVQGANEIGYDPVAVVRAALASPAVPEGYKLVPLKCTPEMRAAWDRAPQSEDDDVEFHGAYRAMIEAAPAVSQMDGVAVVFRNDGKEPDWDAYAAAETNSNSLEFDGIKTAATTASASESKCPNCQGSGGVSLCPGTIWAQNERVICDHCNGTGRAQAPSRDAAPKIKTWQERVGADYNDSAEPTAHEIAMEAEIADLHAALAQQGASHAANAGEVDVVADDLVVEANRKLLLERSRVGLRKYGTTLAASGLSIVELAQHALEEALDLSNYLQTIIQTDRAAIASSAAQEGE
jgi:hypothetical protein